MMEYEFSSYFIEVTSGFHKEWWYSKPDCGLNAAFPLVVTDDRRSRNVAGG